MSLEVTREQYGDIIVRKTDGEMNVAELIEALGHMPKDAVVHRYANEWGIDRVAYTAGYEVDLD